MELQQNFPEVIGKSQRSLLPFVKQRQEVAQIRRVLASHLSSQVKQNGDSVLNRPLSLTDPTCNADVAPHGVRGLQKEYLRCVRANLKAQDEYHNISRAHRLQHKGEDEGSGDLHEKLANDSGSPVQSFADLVGQRQRHERLCIIQDYLDVLSQKPVASEDYLDPHSVWKDVEALPKMSPEVLNRPTLPHSTSEVDLDELVVHLEKSVLRAKMLLAREQNLLAKVKVRNAAMPGGHGSRLEAVGMTRSALINWIEAELSRAGEGSESLIAASSDSGGKAYIDAELGSIHKQYARYAKARQALVTATTRQVDLPATTTLDEASDIPTAKDDSYCATRIEVTYPYLEHLVSVSNEQKALIQQKSHLTISLSKQLKEANQGLERLTGESHMLPAHPLPSSRNRHRGLEGTASFGDEMSKMETPDSSHYARAWVYAAESTGQATKETVMGTVEEGNIALEHAQQNLLELRRLVGAENEGSESGQSDAVAASGSKAIGIWAVLDGKLGVIKEGS